MNEDLRKWFRQKWVRMNTKGEIIGPCGGKDDSEGKPKCLSGSKARSMTKKDRATVTRRKRREDPNADRKGKPIMVNTEEFMVEGNEPTNPSLWSKAKSLAKQKFDVYPSAYANGWAAKYYKSKGGGWRSVSEETVDEACWKGYKRVGMKKKGDRMVPNCVPEATDIIAKAKARVNEQSSDTFPWHEDPKNPTRKVGARKDEFGNPVKNVARYLAKKAMKANEEVEDLDETAKIVAHLQKRYGDNIRKSHVRSAANDFGVDVSKLAKAVRTKLGKNMLDEEDDGWYTHSQMHGSKKSEKHPKGISAIEWKSGIRWHHGKNKRINVKEEIDPDLEAELKATRVTKKSMEDSKKTRERASGVKEQIEHGNYDTSKSKPTARTLKPEVKPTMNPAFKPKTRQSSVGTLARVRSGMAKKAGANLKMDPDTGTPDHFTAAQRRKKGLDEAAPYQPARPQSRYAGKANDAPDNSFAKRNQAAIDKRNDSIKRSAEAHRRMLHPDTAERKREKPSGYSTNAAGYSTSDRYKSVKEEVEGKVYSVHVKGDSKDHNSSEFKKHLTGWGGELHYASDKGAAYKFKKEYQATGFHHGVKSGFKSLDSEHDGQVKEELGKDNEWGTDALRKKYAAMTPGQESMAADKIPTFDPRYDDVPTEYCGGIKEALLSEISAKGAVARADFRAKIQKVLADPAAISKAKKTLAKKKAAEKAAEPVHLVMQLRKASSIGSKVQFRNGESHHVAPNHVEKFNDKYHSLKSSIEKESLINRAHKSHADFFKAIAEETLDITQQGGGPQYDTHRGNGGHMQTLELDGDEMIFADFDEKDMEELEAEVDNMTWEDIVDEYDDEELEYVDGEEEIEEGVTPQGRLKKRFAAMRNKTRRNMARNLSLRRVSTPDRIKARSISTARRMVYQRFLRGRDKSSMSAAEKTRIEAQVKRLAPSVARLSVRIVGQVRKLEQSRIKNRTRGKKK